MAGHMACVGYLDRRIDTAQPGVNGLVKKMPALDQVDRDVDVAPRGFGIGTGLVRRVHQGLGGFVLQTRQADVEASPEEIIAARRA